MFFLFLEKQFSKERIAFPRNIFCSSVPLPVAGMVSQGPPFTSPPPIPSVPGVKHNQPSISTVTTATQPLMSQQQVAPNQQQPVPPPGQPAPNQQPQQPPQQQPTPNQPTPPSVQPNMVIYDKHNKTSQKQNLMCSHVTS